LNLPGSNLLIGHFGSNLVIVKPGFNLVIVLPCSNLVIVGYNFLIVLPGSYLMINMPPVIVLVPIHSQCVRYMTAHNTNGDVHTKTSIQCLHFPNIGEKENHSVWQCYNMSHSGNMEYCHTWTRWKTHPGEEFFLMEQRPPLASAEILSIIV
jgi:hypothetical protein